ncbi:MAG: TrkH family potassium uptake protein [Eubacterium sp.]
MKKSNYSLTYPKIVAVGFALLILLGSALLMLPISSKQGGVSYIDALFTATSATCITGLVPFDTFTNWSVFGQLVIICLIQVGGLGFITMLSVVVNLLKKKMSLKQKMLLKEGIGSLNLGDVKELVKAVLIFTAACEITGAVILSTRFIPLAGVRRGIYMALFTSISAFCNAGFDLMGMFSPSSSLMTVNDDPVVILTVSALIVFGGLGFIVWQDMKHCKFKIKSFSVHTKLVLISTALLVSVGAVLFFAFEYNNTLSNMNFTTKAMNALFCSITPRTAGFNSVDTGALTSQSKMLTVILMFIGGSSGSTAGGVKTTTIAVLILCVISTTRNKESVDIFDRRITLDTVKSAVSVVCINFMEILAGVILISFIQNEFSLIDIIFECASAMGTVGMSTGITPDLNAASKIVIIVLMYIGRLTSVIFALSFVAAKPKITTQKPKGRVMVG